MILILSLIAISALFYIYILKPYKYWEIRGVKHDKPVVFFGSMWDFLLQRMAYFVKVDEIYKKHEGERYCGYFEFLKPILLIRDPELMKDISIKEFESFANHDIFSDVSVDPLWSKNLVSATGEQWHSMRSVLSPSFTSSKMKIMYTLITDSMKQVTKHYSTKKENIITLQTKDFFTRLSNDIFATCSLGVNCDSIGNPDNEVFKNAMDLTDFHGIKVLRFLGYSISPTIMKFLGIPIFPASTGAFFTKLIKDTLNLRAEKKIVRNDMIHLMLKAREELEQNEKSKNNKNFCITDEDMTAQALIFLLGGMETVSNLLTFLIYELAVNKNIQDTLFKEVTAISDENVSYEQLMGMKYLDMFISEGLRKWPTMPLINRLCTKNFEIPSDSTKGKTLLVEKGTAVWFSTFSIHRNPKYFEDPERFDPERFSDENKGNIIPNTYIPFGNGPRNCMGSRFTLLQVKTVLYHLLKDFEFVPVDKTIIPVTFSNKDFNMYAADGMWMGLKKRN